MMSALLDITYKTKKVLLLLLTHDVEEHIVRCQDHFLPGGTVVDPDVALVGSVV